MFNRSNLLKLAALLIVILIQIPLILPFFHAGFFPSHDDVQVVRIFEAFQSIHYGMFPPRWASGLLYGHGYPIFVFYPPLVYLMGAFLVFLGLNFLVATKLVFIFGFMLGAIGMFLLMDLLAGVLAGLSASIAFSFVIYRAVDVYVRGDLSEFYAYELIPWVLWANIKLIQSGKKMVWILTLSILLSLVVLSHNISAFILGIFLLLFNGFYLLRLDPKKRMRLFLDLVKSAILSLTLTCFYWLPLLFETQFIKLNEFANYPYYQYYLNLPKLWYTKWAYGGFIEKDPMSLQFGQVLLIASLGALIANIFIKSTYRSLIFFLSGCLIVFTFLETNFSSFLWDKITLLHFLQFPWRLHILTTTIGVMLLGLLIYLLQQSKLSKQKIGRFGVFVVAVIIVGLCIKESYLFFRPKQYDLNHLSVSETTTWNDEYMPKWVKNKPKDYAPDKIKFISGEGLIQNTKWGYVNKDFQTEASRSGIVQIAHVYYPGWVAKIDNQKTEIKYDNEAGLMTIAVPSGVHQISFQFTRTWWRVLSEITSLVGIMGVIGLLLISLKKRLISK